MQDRQQQRIVVITGGGLNPQVMINHLFREFPGLHVIQEQYETKSVILKRRARRFGWPHALGQLATMMASRFGKRLTARRTAEILREYRLSGDPVAAIPITEVVSINDPSSHATLQSLRPDVVFTISCRILSPATLAAIPCPVINFHAGINPMYRGQMGGYWSRVEGDEANFGATVHLVDAGIDTGSTLYEQRVRPAASDTMTTYPLLMTAASTEITVRAITDALEGKLSPYPPQGPSALRYPPPIWTWLYHGLTKRIW